MKFGPGSVQKERNCEYCHSNMICCDVHIKHRQGHFRSTQSGSQKLEKAQEMQEDPTGTKHCVLVGDLRGNI